MYDTFLRPYLPGSLVATASTPGPEGKGKEKAIEPAIAGKSSSASGAVGGGGGGGMKITLGGKRIGEIVDASAASDSTLATKPKKLKLDKYYSHLVQDIPGQI